MKMDLKGLCTRLAQAKEEETVSTRGVDEYLLNKVLRPLMRNETVLLKDIDFGRFDSDDVHRLTNYYEALEMEGRKLEQLAGVFAGLEPMACKVRRFC